MTWIESRGSPVAVSVKQDMRDLESKVDVVVRELDWMVITMVTVMAMLRVMVIVMAVAMVMTMVTLMAMVMLVLMASPGT